MALPEDPVDGSASSGSLDRVDAGTPKIGTMASISESNHWMEAKVLLMFAWFGGRLKPTVGGLEAGAVLVECPEAVIFFWWSICRSIWHLEEKLSLTEIKHVPERTEKAVGVTAPGELEYGCVRQ